jgi:hypothetical protein
MSAIDRLTEMSTGPVQGTGAIGKNGTSSVVLRLFGLVIRFHVSTFRSPATSSARNFLKSIGMAHVFCTKKGANRTDKSLKTAKRRSSIPSMGSTSRYAGSAGSPYRCRRSLVGVARITRGISRGTKRMYSSRGIG